MIRDGILVTDTTAEVAEILGVSERRVRQLARSGTLTPIGTEYLDARGRPSLVFRHDEVAEYEHRVRRDGGRIATLAAFWRGEA